MEKTKFTGKILIVDDLPVNLEVLLDFLGDAGFEVLVATNGKSALERAEYADPDIILLDVMMPEMDGFETCQRLKNNPQTESIPVIFMTALSDTKEKITGFEVGAVDYITKPFQHEEVLARVNVHLTLVQQRREIEWRHEQDRIYFEKLNKMKDEIMQTASHDLKGPLATIQLAADLLAKPDVISDERARQLYLEKIQRGGQRMLMLIRDLLDIAEIETGVALQKRDQVLNEFLESTVNDFSLAASEKDVTLQLEVPEEKIWLAIDSTRLSQVLHNLLSNAIKYTPQGGTVTLTAQPDTSQVLIQVSDTGLGIPQNDIPHLFEKFYRVQDPGHREIEGTGLGLSIVKSIVEQHNGEIWVESEMGSGTTFTIALPSGD